MQFQSPSICREPGSRNGSRSIVVGASMAGLLAARVLADHFAEVFIIERDVLPDDASPRAGVPQSRHLHAMLPRGLEILEKMFPGICAELEKFGSIRLDIGNDVAWLTPEGWGLKFESGIEALSVTRDLLDCHVRRRLATISNVRFATRRDVTGLIRNKRGEIVGVRSRERKVGGRGPEEEIKADLTVLASGRQNKIADWFSGVGIERPKTTVINAHIGYASRFYRRPQRQSSSSWKALILQVAPPRTPRGGLVFPVEGDRWLVTLIGGDRDYPPTAEEGFLEFAKSLRSPVLYEVLREAQPLTPICAHRATENRRHALDQIRNWPVGVVVVGDAACAFNPVYGQGLTTAAMEAEALGQLLGQGNDAADFGKTFQKQVAHIVTGPWTLTTSADLRYRSVEGAHADWKTRAAHWYIDRVLRLGTMDKWARRRFLEVQGMIKEASTIFSGDMMRRVLFGLMNSPRCDVKSAALPVEFALSSKA